MMDVHLPALVVGVYAGLVTLAVVVGKVRLSLQLLQDVAKLVAVGVVTSITCCQPLALLLMVVTAYCLYHSLPSPHHQAQGKAVFITGCDRGLGHLLAVHCDSLGMHVFAGCLFPGGEGEASLKTQCSERLRTVALDVTDLNMVKTAVQTVKRELQGKELWGVVNNAGILYVGCLEIMVEDDVQRMMNVNFNGQLNMVRAFLPLLRASHGRLVNVASNAGQAPVPFQAAYCASKAAVAILSESLRFELKPFGIRVSTIIPSGYRTGILQYDRQATGDRWWHQADPEVRESYGRDSFYIENKTKDYKSYLNPDFSGIINKMTDALLEKNPKPFYYKGVLARSLPYLYLHTPSCLADLFLPSLITWYKFDPPVTPVQGGKQD